MFFIPIFVNAVSIDCPNIVNLGLGLNLNKAQPSIWSAIQSDCCVTAQTKVTCDGSQRAIQLNWDLLGLNGTINGTAIPSKMLYLYLMSNQINGSIPTLPSG